MSKTEGLWQSKPDTKNFGSCKNNKHGQKIAAG